MDAAYKGHAKIVDFLLRHGADPSMTDEGGILALGATALHRAAMAGSEATVKILLAYGADVNAINKNGKTPFDYAIAQDHANMARWLFDHGGKSFYNNNDLLIQASQKNMVWLVKAMLSRGADANVKDSTGKSAVYYARKNGNTNIVEVLEAHGASASKQSFGSKPPLPLFSENLAHTNRIVLRKIIKRHGFKPLRENNKYWADQYDASKIGAKELYVFYTSTGAPAMIRYKFSESDSEHPDIITRAMAMAYTFEKSYGSSDKVIALPAPAPLSDQHPFTMFVTLWKFNQTEIEIKSILRDHYMYAIFIFNGAFKKLNAEIAANKHKQQKKKAQAQSNAF